MFGQQNILKELFSKYGWKLVETQVPNDDWIAEVWLIKSVWTPIDCYVFISYEVDPQWEDRNRKKEGVWAINIMLEQPDYWNNDRIDIIVQDNEIFTIHIKPKFEKRISEVFDILKNLRSRFNNLK